MPVVLRIKSAKNEPLCKAAVFYLQCNEAVFSVFIDIVELPFAHHSHEQAIFPAYCAKLERRPKNTRQRLLSCAFFGALAPSNYKITADNFACMAP